MWQNRPPVGHQQHRSEDLMEDEIFGLRGESHWELRQLLRIEFCVDILHNSLHK